MTLLQVEGLTKRYSGARATLALDGVSFDLAAGETLGLIGPSGCGKSTLARVLTRLTPAEDGRITFEGRDWLSLRGRALRQARGGMQMVFQDPGAAFHPQATVAGALSAALQLHTDLPRAHWPQRIAELLVRVDLSPDLAPRPTATLSGGQRQRVALARAIACRPRLLVLDEAVSALDAAIRRQMLELLVGLQREFGLACLFIGHDIAIVRLVSHRIAVMERGRIVEIGPTDAILSAPGHEMTRHLLAAVPQMVASPGDTLHKGPP